MKERERERKGGWGRGSRDIQAKFEIGTDEFV